MWKKPYFLAGVIFGLSLFIAILLLILQSLIGVPIRGLGLTIPVVISYTIGQVYASKYSEPMSHKLKVLTLIYYVIISVIWTFICIILLSISVSMSLSIYEYIIIIPLTLGINILISLIMYWLMGQGCKKYLEKMKK